MRWAVLIGSPTRRAMSVRGRRGSRTENASKTWIALRTDLSPVPLAPVSLVVAVFRIVEVNPSFRQSLLRVIGIPCQVVSSRDARVGDAGYRVAGLPWRNAALHLWAPSRAIPIGSMPRTPRPTIAKRWLPSRPRQALPTHGQARAGAGAPHHRDNDVPRDGDEVLAGEGGRGDEWAWMKDSRNTPF